VGQGVWQVAQAVLQSAPSNPGLQAHTQSVPHPTTTPLVEEQAPPGTLLAVHAYV